MTKSYLILPVSEIPNINFEEVYETSENTLRFSNDNQYTFVKYNMGDRPSIYSEGNIEYNYFEILEILNTDSNWKSDNSLPIVEE